VRGNWAITVSAVFFLVPVLQAGTVSTNVNQRYQTIDGWGTCLAEWDSGARSIYRSTDWRNAYRDLGCNILRVAMNKEVLVHANDYSIPIELGTSLQGNVDLMDFTWTDDLRIWGETAQWLNQNALEPDRVKISGSPWTPPHWMKGPTGNSQDFVGITGDYPTPWLSNQHNPYTPDSKTGASIGGRLKTEDPWTMQQYGRYMAAWVEGFEQQWGVPMYVVSLQNESTFENPFDSMTYIIDQNGNRDFNEYAKGLKAVKDAWEQFGVDTKVMGPHVAHFEDNPGNPYGLWWQDEMIEGIKNHSDPELTDFLDYYNANYYNGTDEGVTKNVAGFYLGSGQVATSEWDWHRPPGVSEDGKGIWFSETGGGQSVWTNGSGGSPGNGAIIVAQKMHNALVHGNASAYVYWQMSDGDAAETTHTLLGSSHLSNPEDSKKYCAFKHFSRYVRPGAQRVEATFENGTGSVGGNSEYDTYNALNVSAYIHDEDETLTYVFVNMEGFSQPVTIGLPGDPNVEAFEVFRTNGGESFDRLSDLIVVDGEVTLTIPAYSLMTLYGHFGEPALPGDANRDGIVSDADYTIWADNYGATGATWSMGDFNGNGTVTEADYTIWADNYGAGAGVPEPATMVLLAMGTSMLRRTRRPTRIEGLGC
jgi:O-glycosyl hydrolase